MADTQRMKQLKGSIPAVVTPMKCGEGQPLDLEAFSQLVDWQICQGSAGIVVAGTTGEAPCLDMEEWTALVEQCVSVVAKRVPVIVGTGTNCTRTTVEKTKAAAALQADAALVCVPFYNKPTQEGIFQHFKAIAEGVPTLPILLYNVPGRVGVDVKAATVARIAKTIPNVFGIKEASGSLERMSELRTLCGPNFSIFCGEDSLSCDAMLSGWADGAVSVTANVMPKKHQLMCILALTGVKLEAKSWDARFQELNRTLFLESNPIPVKWLLGEMGKLEKEAIRLPLVPLSAVCHEEVKKALQIAQE